MTDESMINLLKQKKRECTAEIIALTEQYGNARIAENRIEAARIKVELLNDLINELWQKKI